MRKIPLQYGEQLQFRGSYSHRLRRNKSNGYVSLQKQKMRDWWVVEKEEKVVAMGGKRVETQKSYSLGNRR